VTKRQLRMQSKIILLVCLVVVVVLLVTNLMISRFIRIDVESEILSRPLIWHDS
jgi:sensor histidine kinase regulating citrate/malate metabolism